MDCIYMTPLHCPFALSLFWWLEPLGNVSGWASTFKSLGPSSTTTGSFWTAGADNCSFLGTLLWPSHLLWHFLHRVPVLLDLRESSTMTNSNSPLPSQGSAILVAWALWSLSSQLAMVGLLWRETLCWMMLLRQFLSDLIFVKKKLSGCRFWAESNHWQCL